MAHRHPPHLRERRRSSRGDSPAITEPQGRVEHRSSEASLCDCSRGSSDGGRSWDQPVDPGSQALVVIDVEQPTRRPLERCRRLRALERSQPAFGTSVKECPELRVGVNVVEVMPRLFEERSKVGIPQEET